MTLLVSKWIYKEVDIFIYSLRCLQIWRCKTLKTLTWLAWSPRHKSFPIGGVHVATQEGGKYSPLLKCHATEEGGKYLPFLECHVATNRKTLQWEHDTWSLSPKGDKSLPCLPSYQDRCIFTWKSQWRMQSTLMGFLRPKTLCYLAHHTRSKRNPTLLRS